jgi:prepilin-type N-terminal cleavage/methylation domain-containing protein
MPADAMKHTHTAGFSLLELMVAVLISSIAAMAVVPALQTRFRQAAVDSYTQKVQAGLTQLKANMIGRQDSCIIRFPTGAGSEALFSPTDLDQLAIQEEASNGEEADCPKPSNMGGRTMAATKLRILSIKNTQSDFDNQDLKILISPDVIAINTIGGVASLAQGSEPLIIRVRSDTLHQRGRGQERCVVMHPSTGEITHGSWDGSTFGNGHCTRSS